MGRTPAHNQYLATNVTTVRERVDRIHATLALLSQAGRGPTEEELLRVWELRRELLRVTDEWIRRRLENLQ